MSCLTPSWIVQEGSKYKNNPQNQACEMYLFIATGLSSVQDLGII